MKNVFLNAVLAAAVIAAAASAPARAGTANASFQVSLTILSSCAVDSTQSRPQIACNTANAYRLDLAPQQQLHDNIWTVTF